ncbi:sugar phosphate isomerase/epimerase family protein [Natrarchaeobius sp. A-rgal3]|uniref:sugar phosphate isomerase/epimerase family protein n=1 Tax=Natrarchaeobius versutus TaxID=1679078 RepID=UPI00350EE26F
MNVGVLTAVLHDRPLEESIEYLDGIGVDAVELACGGFVGDGHVDTETYLDDESAQAKLLALTDRHEMEISALSTHNNPIHPNDERAAEDDRQLRDAIELAGQLGVDAITCFSGLPGGSPNDETPNWITAPWPSEHLEALEYQWEVAIDYWSEIADHADEHDVNVGIELHPNMLVYEPEGMLRLREETGERIGANLDPSHLYWQGIDATEAIRVLGDADAIHHFHAKDTKVYDANARVKGVLDTTPYTEESDRSWLFRSIGYGHGEDHWKDVVSTLRMVGYDGTLSIEHEDSLTSGREGLEKAVDVLSRAVFETAPGDAYWAE